MAASFYFYRAIPCPSTYAYFLTDTLFDMGVKGRVFIAPEGMNGQLVIPSNYVSAVESEIGVSLNIEPSNTAISLHQSFSRVKVTTKKHILAHNLSPELLPSLGQSMKISPADWDSALARKGDKLILDIRNYYESDLGRFDQAIPLNTRTFSETWEVLDDILGGKDTSTPIYMYCTGGIRCEPVAQYLNSIGFNNNFSLDQGIVGYSRNPESLKKKFKGTNFIFDNRLHQQLTKDILGTCEQCSSASYLYRNCMNAMCGRIYLLCDTCRAMWIGCCSYSCSTESGEHTGEYIQHKSESYEMFNFRRQFLDRLSRASGLYFHRRRLMSPAQVDFVSWRVRRESIQVLDVEMPYISMSNQFKGKLIPPSQKSFFGVMDGEIESPVEQLQRLRKSCSHIFAPLHPGNLNGWREWNRKAPFHSRKLYTPPLCQFNAFVNDDPLLSSRVWELCDNRSIQEIEVHTRTINKNT